MYFNFNENLKKYEILLKIKLKSSCIQLEYIHTSKPGDELPPSN